MLHAISTLDNQIIMINVAKGKALANFSNYEPPHTTMAGGYITPAVGGLDHGHGHGHVHVHFGFGEMPKLNEAVNSINVEKIQGRPLFVCLCRLVESRLPVFTVYHITPYRT